jgi:ammonia channel protein AmtB
VVVVLLWSGILSSLVFGLLRILGLLRISSNVEEEGLDSSEHGVAKSRL